MSNVTADAGHEGPAAAAPGLPRSGQSDGPPLGRVLFTLLAALVGLQALSTDLYLPALPALRIDLGVDVVTAQLTLSVFVATFALSCLVYGPLSDRFGRRPVLIAGLCIYAVGTLGCLLADGATQLLVARAVQAAGAGAGPVLARAVIRDLYAPDRAASTLGYITAAMSAIPITGPIIGGALVGTFGWRSAFVTLLLIGVLLTIGAMAVLAETNVRRDPMAMAPRRLLVGYASIARNRSFRMYVTCAAAGYWGIFAFLSAAPFVLISGVGVSEQLFGFLFAATVSGWLVGTTLTGRMVRRLGTRAMARIGARLTFVGGVITLTAGLFTPPSIVTIVMPYFIVFVGVGMLIPCGHAGAIAPFPGQAGAASALAGFLQLGTSVPVGILVGRLHDGSAIPMASVAVVAGLVALAALSTPLTAPGSGAATPPDSDRRHPPADEGR